MNDSTPMRHTTWTPDGEIAATPTPTHTPNEAEPKPTEEALIAAIANVYRHRLRGRDSLGPAMGPQPDDRGSPVAVEHVLITETCEQA
jgi:hypothetical protein